MKLHCIAILALSVAGMPVSAGESPILPLVLHDGVYFEADEFSGGMSLRVKGPDQFIWNGTVDKGESMFLDATNLNDKALPDGLYKYELVMTPAVLVNRGTMSVAEQNAFRSANAVKRSPISGSFRVVNGAILDPYEEELSHD